jgi:outer membrane protein OmpA-like peptidoglycan-associated protein
MIRNFLFTLALSLLYLVSPAQIIDPEEAAKRKAENRANNKIDRSIDKVFDKAEEGVIGIFKKKDKDSEAEKDDQELENETPDTGGGKSNTETAQKKGVIAYSKFDFIPGENVVSYEDFSQDEVGDFPAKWNSDTSGEIVTIDGREGNWLNISQNGVFYPEFVGVLPENFTLEMEVGFAGEISGNYQGLMLNFVKNQDKLLKSLGSDRTGKVQVNLHPYHGSTAISAFDTDGSEKLSNSNSQSVWTKENPMAKVSIWRQKTRIRVYINEEKVWDIPRAFEPGVDYRMVMERSYFRDGDLFIGELRVAEGKPDTRSKLITEGKFVTRGITFDVGSATIKAESYPVIKDIAGVLAENPEVKIKIIGHTDSDGNPASNLELSKKRAAAVAESLQREFSIPSNRIITDGKGDTEPSEPNTTPQGKANNRRVEFVKL